MNADHITALCEALECSADWLLGIRCPDPAARLQALFARLPEAHGEALIEYLERVVAGRGPV